MIKRLKIFLSVVFTIMVEPVNAEQSKDFGDYTIHYNAFTTDILSPSIAKSYRITRSKNRALLNISILKKVMGTNVTPSKAVVIASATNLTNQLRELKFREVLEEGAIYYLAELPVNNGETLKFSINVIPAGETGAYKFSFQEQFITNF